MQKVEKQYNKTMHYADIMGRYNINEAKKKGRYVVDASMIFQFANMERELGDLWKKVYQLQCDYACVGQRLANILDSKSKDGI